MAFMPFTAYSFPERVIEAVAAGVERQTAAFIATLPPASAP